MFASRLEITESALGILALKTRFSLVQLLGIQVLGIFLSWDLIDWLLSMHGLLVIQGALTGILLLLFHWKWFTGKRLLLPEGRPHRP